MTDFAVFLFHIGCALMFFAIGSAVFLFSVLIAIDLVRKKHPIQNGCIGVLVVIVSLGISLMNFAASVHAAKNGFDLHLSSEKELP